MPRPVYLWDVVKKEAYEISSRYERMGFLMCLSELSQSVPTEVIMCPWSLETFFIYHLTLIYYIPKYLRTPIY